MATVAEEIDQATQQPDPKTDQTEPIFSRIGFKGNVHMREYFEHPSGSLHRNIMGIVSVYRDIELVGFNTRGTEANWAAVIEGETERVVILGCQIRAVTSYQKEVGGQGSFPTNNAHDTYIVP